MRGWAVLAGAALALAACGRGAPPPLLVEIVTARADPEPPREGWRLRGEDGREHALAPTGTKGDRGPIYGAQAPAGRYTLVGSPPWGPMSGPKPMALAPNAPPAKVAAGLERTLYLAAPEGRRIEDATLWAPAAGGRGERLLEVREQAAGDEWTAVRFTSAGDWQGSVRVAARFDDGTFAEPARVALPAAGTPWGWALRVGPTAALDVLLVGGSPPEGTAFHASVSQDRLHADLAAPVTDGGRVRFERFPLVTSGAVLGRADGPGPEPYWALRATDLVRGDVRLWAPGPAAPGEGSLEVEWTPRAPEDLAEGSLQIRREEGDSYGLRSAAAAGDLPPGKYRLLWTGPRTASVKEVALDHGAAPSRVTIPVGPVCRVQITLEGALPPGRRYSIVAHRTEDGRAVLAHGFVVRALTGADHEVVLPPGRYRFAAEVLGREGPAVALALDAPGSRASVRLEPPR